MLRTAVAERVRAYDWIAVGLHPQLADLSQQEYV